MDFVHVCVCVCVGLWLELKGRLLIFEVQSFPLLKFRMLQMLSIELNTVMYSLFDQGKEKKNNEKL